LIVSKIPSEAQPEIIHQLRAKDMRVSNDRAI
jgi:hypothetical protein